MAETISDFDFDFEEEERQKKKKKAAEQWGYETHTISFIGPDGPMTVYELSDVGIEYGEPDPDDPIWVEWEIIKLTRLGAGAVRHATNGSKS